MVQEMTQFPTQSLCYDSPYLLSPFKSEAWPGPAFRPSDFEELRPAAGSFDGSTPPEASPEPPSTATGKKKQRKAVAKSSYKHVPHREKPPHLVARRNARERRRVQAVNTAFSRLRKCVPAESKSKRLSKVKTLHRAIEYIQMLQEMLSNADEDMGSEDMCLGTAGEDSLNKENELHQRWLQLPTSWGDDNQNSCLSFYDDFADAM